MTVGILMCGGCGRKNALQRVAVEGAITLNGRPLECGSITFVPTNLTSGPKAGGVILQGQYRLPEAEGPPIGDLIVQISAPQPVSGAKPPENEAEVFQRMSQADELLPTRYNHASTLQVTTKLDEDNRFNFDLKTP